MTKAMLASQCLVANESGIFISDKRQGIQIIYDNIFGENFFFFLTKNKQV